MAKVLLGNVKGPKGDKGDTGAQGIQGIQGIQGEQGPKGDTGPQGATGSQGPQGIAGKNGKDGVGIPSGGANGQVIAYNGSEAIWRDEYTNSEIDALFTSEAEAIESVHTEVKSVQGYQPLWIQNITIATDNFVADETYSDYPYKATLNLSSYSKLSSISDFSVYQPLTTYSVATLGLGISFLENTITSGIDIYASEQPSSEVVIDSIRLEKVNA